MTNLRKQVIQKSSELEISQQLSFLRETMPKNIASAKSIDLDQATIEAEKQIVELLADEFKDHFFTAFSDSKPTGYTWLRSQSDELFVAYLYILKPYRKKGIGSSVMNWIEDFARDGGYNRLGLVVSAQNSSAISLYERSGYTFGSMKMTKQILS